MTPDEMKAMPDDELVAANIALGAQQDAIRAERFAINEELRGRGNRGEIARLQAQIAALQAGEPGAATAPGVVLEATMKAE